MRVVRGGWRHDNHMGRAAGSHMFAIGVDIDVGCYGGVIVGADTMWQPNLEGC